MVMMQTLIGSYATVIVAQEAVYYFTLRGSGGGGGGEDQSSDSNSRSWTSGGPGGGGAQVEIRIDDVPSGMQFVMAVPSGGGAGDNQSAGGAGGGGGGATVLAAIHNGVEQLIAVAAGGGAGGGGGDGLTSNAATRAGSGGAGLAGSNSKSASVNDGDGHIQNNRPYPGGGATGTANGTNSQYSALNPVTTTTYGNKGGSGGRRDTSSVQLTQTSISPPSHVISDSYAIQGGFGGEPKGGEGGGAGGGGGYFAGAGGAAPNGGNDGAAGGGGGSSYIAGGIWSGSSTLTFGSDTITINVVGNNTSGARGVLINTGEANPDFRLSAAQTTSVQWTGSIADLSEKGRGGNGSNAVADAEDPQSGAAGVIIYGTDLASPTVVEPTTHDRVTNGVPNTDLPAVQTTVTT